MTERLFRQRHPIFTGLLVLVLLILILWAGIAFFVPESGRSHRAGIFTSEAIGVVEVKGVIVDSEETLEALVQFREDPRIKGVVLRVDSPGGAVGASQEIYDEVRRTNAVKPVVASMGSVAASGGLYVALGARRIVANPGTLTGSMGVIIKFANLEGLFDKLGYRSEVVKSGNLKDLGSPDRKMSPEERRMLEGMIGIVHEQFVDAVSQSRSLDRKKVKSIADGRIFSGQQALEYGLIDQLGNFTDAILLAAGLAGIKGEKMPELIYLGRDEFSLLRLLTGEQGQALLGRVIDSGPFPAYLWEGNLR